MPMASTNRTSSHFDGSGDRVIQAMPRANPVCSTDTQMMSHLRSKRSARAPPTMDSSMSGMSWAKESRLTKVAEWVRE